MRSAGWFFDRFLGYSFLFILLTAGPALHCPAQATASGRVALPGNVASTEQAWEKWKRKQAQNHAPIMDAEEAIRRYGSDASSNPGAQPLAPFVGNTTIVAAPTGDGVAMHRDIDPKDVVCSLEMFNLSITLNDQDSSYMDLTRTTSYELTLHNEAGLTTKPDVFANGCKDPNLGTSSRPVVFVGQTTTGLYVGAAAAYDGDAGRPELFALVANFPSGTFKSFTQQSIDTNPVALATADLNGDGNGDIVAGGLNGAATAAVVTVLLGNPDGSFQSGVDYALPGNLFISETVDDVNGDGKPDIIAATGTTAGGPSQYSVLLGNGDGTFQQPKSYTVNTSNGNVNPLPQIIAATLTSSGHKDIISATGTVFLGNGDGTFTQAAQRAFVPPHPPLDIAAADFNHDGKTDVAVDDGQAIHIFYGNGDGTFQAGPSYATLSNEGELIATDLDGDGNVDVFSGLGNDGIFGGDQFFPNVGYALMGNTNGTFVGAPFEPFVNNGADVADLNEDGNLDVLGLVAPLNVPPVFISYLGDGKGGFKQGPTLTLPTTGNNVVAAVNSYVVADFNGDKKPDLLFISDGSGYYFASGNGDGSFGTPVFTAAPNFGPNGDADQNPLIDGLFTADFNHDGKPDIVYAFAAMDSKTGNNLQGYAVQLGNGDGTFQAPAITYTYNAPAAGPLVSALALVADVNDDGNPDLLTVKQIVPAGQQPSSQAQVFLGKGDGSFSAPANIPAADNPQAPSSGLPSQPFALGDLNGDGKLDLVSLGNNHSTGSGELAVSLGNGDGTFQNPTILQLDDGGTELAGVAVSDFNGDGKMDVAVTGDDPPFDSGIFLGNGDGTLQTVSESENFVGPTQVLYLTVGAFASVYDFNKDGKPDLLAGSTVLMNAEGEVHAGPGASSTALTASSTNIHQGQSVAFTATVTGTAGDSTVPTGTVRFLNGTTTLSSATLNSSGQATYSTNSLAAGTYSITASYGGDSNFDPSTSSAVSLTVTSGTPDFSLAASAGTLSIAPGQSGTDTISVTPKNGFNQATSFACSGLPSETSCSFSPMSVTPNGTAASRTTMTITTTAPTNSSRNIPAWPFSGGGIVAACGLFFLAKRRRMPSLVCLMLLLAIGGVALGCGGGSSNSSGSGGSTNNPGTPAGISTVTVTATAGSISHTTKITLTVQ